VELSSFYVDVTKDLLYTLAPQSPERRSAQTAIYQAVVTLAKLIAPVMPFTAEEVWNCLPARETESVHLASFPVVEDGLRNAELEARWAKLMEVRGVAALELEKARQNKVIGKSLEAQVEIAPESEATKQLLASFGAALETVLIVSKVQVGQLTNEGLRVTVSPASGQKCVRCWRWSDDVGRAADHPQLCGRCTSVVQEIKS
jgi:isoleucyl-tRNA synthetase